MTTRTDRFRGARDLRGGHTSRTAPRSAIITGPSQSALALSLRFSVYVASAVEIRLQNDLSTPKHRHHCARRPRQDHARRRIAQAIGDGLHEERAPRPHHGFQRPRARARHHHSLEEHRDSLERLPDQHRRHAWPRRLRRRGRTCFVDGRLGPAARRRRRRTDAAEPLRHPEGLFPRPPSGRRDQQDRPLRGPAELGSG